MDSEKESIHGMPSYEKSSKWIVGIVEDDLAYQKKIQEELSLVSEVAEIRTWKSAEEFWRDERRRGIDLVLLDVKLGGMSGVDLTERLSEKHPEVRIVILTNLNSDQIIFQALRNGAIGYLLKSELDDIRSTVKIVMNGGGIITPTIAYRVLGSFKKTNLVMGANLTDREKQILELMVRGKTIALVADFLKVSVNTVNHHAKNIYKKLNVHNRSELARKVVSSGLLDHDLQSDPENIDMPAQ